MNTQPKARFAAFVYRTRWISSLLVLALVALLGSGGAKRVTGFTEQMSQLGDTTNGSGQVPPLLFDPRMSLWFGSEDQAVATYDEIEERFVAEDYIMVTFEEDQDEFGVFGRESLATIARLTEGFLRIPGVRHVRSLTSNPWIRYGEISDAGGSEEGLLISDLVEGDPLALSDAELIERMVAVLGAERVAARLGEARVRAVLGSDVDLAEFNGEPLLLGTIVNGTGSVTAIQVQVLRPRVGDEQLAEVFGEDQERRDVAKTLYSVQAQRASLRGIEHVLRLEQGLAIPTAELSELESWIHSLEPGAERQSLLAELADPRRNFMQDAGGERVRKFHEYDPAPGGGWVDKSDPGAALPAPPGFQPAPLSTRDYHVGGVPLFERNFEDVGMSDAKYMGFMFLGIIILLIVVFRSVAGVIAPLVVVFGSIGAMVGAAFAWGDLFNNMTIIAPNMLTAVAIADAVHLVAAWVALRHEHTTKQGLIIDVLRRNAKPVFLTSVTTAVGYYSLMISEMIPVTKFGYTSGLGTIMAYLLSMTLVPAFLSLAPLPASKAKASQQKQATPSPGPGLADRLTDFVFRRRATIVVVSLILMFLAGVGLYRLRIDSDFRAMFPGDNPVMSDFHWIESRMGGVGDLEIVFEGQSAGDAAFEIGARERLSALRLQQEGLRQGHAEFQALSEAEARELQELEAREAHWSSRRIAVSGRFLRDVDAFEARLHEEMQDPGSPLSAVTDLISPLDILRRMHQVQNENQASFYRVPSEEDVAEAGRQASLSFDEWTEEWLMIPGQDASSLAAQYYLQYENGARPGENLATQVSMDRSQFRIQGRLKQAPSVQTVAAARLIEEIAREEFPYLGARVASAGASGSGEAQVLVGDEPKLKVSGKMLLFARTTRIFTIGFLKSISIALVVITILIALIFRSLRIAVVSLIPNVLPILLPLSAFGLLGIPLDAPAIFVSSVALGVCVDDSIHFFTKFMLARERGLSVRDAVRYTYGAVGRAISFTTIILIIGFAMLALSDFAPNYLMGTLAATMIGLAWLADIVVTPAVLSYLHPESSQAAAQGRPMASPSDLPESA